MLNSTPLKASICVFALGAFVTLMVLNFPLTPFFSVNLYPVQLTSLPFADTW